MYGSVEMLLKFCAETFFFKSTGEKSRKKSSAAHVSVSFNVKISHWLRRHFTHNEPGDRIHSALVNFPNNKY